MRKLRELTVTLNAADRARLRVQAKKEGLTLEAYVQAVIEHLAQPMDAQILRSLPREHRNRLLAAQAAAAASLYSADLARPVEERELTAFTALDGEPVYDRAR